MGGAMTTVDAFREHARKKVLLFMRRQVYDAPPERGPCLRFTLRHLRADGSPTSDIETAIVPHHTGPNDAPGQDELERMADDLVNEAIDDADGMGRGVQRYVILAFHDKTPGEHTSREILRVSGGKSTYDAPENGEYGIGDVSDSEGPDARGLTAQHMRHVEAMMKQTIVGWDRSMRTLTEQNHMLSSTVEQLMGKHLSSLQLVEQLMTQDHQRKLESRKAEIWVKGTEEIVDKLKILLPHVVNRAAGRKLLPTKSSPGEQELVSLVETLRPEQLDRLKELFTPDQLLAVLSIVERVMKEAEERKAEGGAATAAVIPIKTGEGK